jgi:glutathione S-transferase
MPATRIIGSYVSPYVRKVLAVMHLKRIPYEIDPIVPFFGSDEFSRVSPLRRIPVLIDDRVTIPDSTVICEYLEERYPQVSVYPAGPAARARMRWLEEYADSRMGEVLIWQLFNQQIRRAVWREEPDQAVLDAALRTHIPHILDFLESEVPAAGFLFGNVSVADIAIGCFFRNAEFMRYEIDAARWPRTAAFVARVLGLEALARLRPFEDRAMRTRIPQLRDTLAEMGAPITADTLGTAEPRRGLMRID